MVWTTLLRAFSSSQPTPPRKEWTPHVPSERDSDLYDLVLDMHWDRVVEYAHQHPITARHQEGDSLETPLHVAVQLRPPVRAIRALLDAFVDAPSVPERKGEYPLHIACRYNASLEVIQKLVKDRPGVACLETKWGGLPVVSLWRSNASNEARADYTSDFWQKMLVLLRAVAQSRREQYQRGGDDDDDDDRDDNNRCLVHAAVSMGSLGCPVPVLDFCLAQHADQVRVTDQSGRLPLHIVTGPTSWTCRAKRRYKPREEETLERLLRLHPEAARVSDPTTPGRRLPLHHALAHRHTWDGGVCHLIQCAPEVLLQPDPACGLLPFLAAATPVGETVVDLNTVYQTLRFFPAALETARQDCEVEIETRGVGGSDASFQTNKMYKQQEGDNCLWLCAVAGIALGIAVMIHLR